jgi:Ca2+-binding RTX toxin-like protein
MSAALCLFATSVNGETIMNTEALESRQLLSALTSGVVLNGTIATSNQVDSNTITVASGAPFLVAVHDTSNSSYQPRVKVLSPSSATVLDQNATDGFAAVVPTASTGTYTVQVSSAGGTGSYSLIVFRSTANLGDTEFQANGSGQRDADTVSPGDDDFYVFDVTANQSMTVTLTENNVGAAFDPRLALIAPDGRIVGNSGSETGVRFEERATKTGRYYAVVTDDGDNDTGVYGIAFTRVPGAQYSGDPDTNVTLPPATTRQIDVPGGDADAFELPNIQAGDTLSVTLSRITNSALDPDLVLYDPNGAQIVRGTRSNGNATSSLTATAGLSGSYWVVARDYEADDGGMGNFRYEVTPGPTSRVVTVNGTEGDDSIVISLNDNSLTVDVNGSQSKYAIGNVDRFEIFAGDGDDDVLMDTSTVPAYVSAGSGDDVVRGSTADDTITGGSGRNRLFGGNGKDRINGSGGRDFIYGEAGDDRLYGQGGSDYIDGGGNVDRVYGGDGDDSLQGGSSNDRIYAGNGNDTLIGGKGNDYLNGESGTDLALAKEDGDTLISIESLA